MGEFDDEKRRGGKDAEKETTIFKAIESSHDSIQ
jgi:hypothetical protein